MGEDEPSSGGLVLLPNGLFPDEAASVVRVLDSERWSKAEERTADLIAFIRPNLPSEERRNAVADYVQRLDTKCLPCQQLNKMACTSFNFPTSPAPNIKTIGRSESSKELRNLVTSVKPRLKNSRSMGIFSFQFSGLRPSMFDPESTSVVDHDQNEGTDNVMGEGEVEKRANWVERLIELRRHWRNRQGEEKIKNGDDDGEIIIGECGGGCEVSYGEEDEDEQEQEERSLDRESFSRFLENVPRSDVKVFSQLAFLCNIAYVIPDIKPKDLKRRFGLKLVTSSLEKKAEAAKTKAQVVEDEPSHESVQVRKLNLMLKLGTRASVAYGIAASAASYVQSEGGGSAPTRQHKSEVAAYVAASTMTAVVAAGEREKSEAAEELRSLHSSPCEWFVCDDPDTCTRCFVVQGSDSLASWHANLFFEPTKFEETDCIVHRGIYEAAKGMYTQLMPEIMEHLEMYGNRAKLRFTGHSLGGSLALLVHLMLLTRKAVKPSALRPVVTFGSPFVFCGGHKIFKHLGIDESQIHCVMMHRDIVPRAFSCNYPNHVANVLKRLNATFRSHTCLIKNKHLYSPMGKLFILQPEETSSPHHPLLPNGCSLYALDKTKYGFCSSVLRTFLNSPHPLESLSDPTAYGSHGTILRDHDSSNYLKAINEVLKLYKSNDTSCFALRIMRSERSDVLWPLLTSPSPHIWFHESDTSEGNMVKKEFVTGV